MKKQEIMTGEGFAKEFINDLNEDLLKNLKIFEDGYRFSWQVYEIDKDLTILKSELNKVGYDLKLQKPEEIPSNQEWKLIKL